MPGGGRADRIHDRLLQHLRQRPFEHVQSRQREHVDAGVVVFVERSRLVHFALGPLLGGLSPRRAIRPIGLAPERPGPVARLAQQVVPGDGRVVFGREQVDALGHVGCDAIRHVANLPLVEGNADDRRQKRFRDAERHVRARGVAPLRDDGAAMDDDAVASSSRLGRSDQRIVGRLVSKLLRDRNSQVFRVRDSRGRGRTRSLRPASPCRSPPRPGPASATRRAAESSFPLGRPARATAQSAVTASKIAVSTPAIRLDCNFLSVMRALT